MYKIVQSGIIVSLLNDAVKPIFLLGAGASKQSGIKLVVEIVEEAAKWAYCKENGIHVDDPRLTMSDWKKWLTNFPWYTEDYSILYPTIIEELLNPRQARKDFFLKVITPDVPASKGYEVLCELMHLNLIDTILTTNFDNCLHHASVQIRRPPVIHIIKTPDDLSQFSYNPRYPQLIYLHGSVEHYTDQNLIDEIQKMDLNLASTLKPLLKDHPIIVVGYRGFEASIMNNLFLDNLTFTNNFHQGIYWCVMKRDLEKIDSGEQKFPELFTKLANAVKSNFQIIPIDGFDELMTKDVLGKLQANQIDLKSISAAKSSLISSNSPANSSITWTNSIGPLEIAIIRERVKNYSERLRIKVYEDEEWLLNEMVRLRIAEAIDIKRYELTTSGMLLFSSKTQEYIKGAYTVLRFIGPSEWLQKITTFSSERESHTDEYSKGVIERIISGNLWNQLNEITDSLTLINRPFRLKGETSENVYPYPTLALKEVIVNCLVHRDYSVEGPIVIEVYPMYIAFRSPGGLVEEVKRQLTFPESIEEEIRKGRRGIKGYRNPIVADLFYGAGAMDKEGSGLFDVLKQVTNNLSTVTFGPTNDNCSFEVKVYKRIEDVDELTHTATPLVVNASSKFAGNLFELLKLPERIYYADTSARRERDIFKMFDNIWLPPFILYNEKVWSFFDLSEFQNPLKKCVDAGTVECMSIKEFTELTGTTREFVQLLNKSFIDHLFSIGLRVDTKKKRAYFTKNIDGTCKEIKYQARVKKATRTVAKPHVNLANGNVYYWEHKSIWFSFENIGDKWYIIINPAYVFTTDGIKNLLKSERVNILSTKKASRDYNMSVHNDLTFWANYISQGNQNAFLLRQNSREINEGKILGPIPPDIVISAQLPTVVINDVSLTEEFVEPTYLEDIEEVERELEALAKEEQEKRN